MKKSDYRKAISLHLRKFNKINKPKYGHTVTLSTIDSFKTLPRACEQESKKTTKEHLEDELFLSYLSLECLTWISLGIIPLEDKKPPIFLNEHLKITNLPNSNLIVRNLITQITNYSLSIVSLVERGLDNPARALLRTTNELIWQTLVLLSDKNIFEEYSKAHDPEQANKIWHALFAKGKLNKKMEGLESRLGLSDEILQKMKNWRIQNQKFLSQAVHHSFLATNVGAFSEDFESDFSSLALLGRASSSSKTTLKYLNHELCYFIIQFFSIIENIYKIELDLKKNYWYWAKATKECIIILNILKNFPEKAYNN